MPQPTDICGQEPFCCGMGEVKERVIPAGSGRRDWAWFSGLPFLALRSPQRKVRMNNETKQRVK